MLKNQRNWLTLNVTILEWLIASLGTEQRNLFYSSLPISCQLIWAYIPQAWALVLPRFWVSIRFYTAGWNVWGDWVLAVYHHNHQNWVPSILTHNLWLIFIRMKQKKFFFWKNKIQNGRLKKRSILNIFLWKFHGLVFGLVELIDVKDIDVALPISAPYIAF